MSFYTISTSNRITVGPTISQADGSTINLLKALGFFLFAILFTGIVFAAVAEEMSFHDSLQHLPPFGKKILSFLEGDNC